MAPFFTGLAKNLGGYGFGRLQQVEGPSGGGVEYLYTGAQQNTVVVPGTTFEIKFAGVGGGGDSVIADGPNFGSGAGGGGAANLSGYTINPAVPYRGTTLYIGVGGPSARRNTYVRTTSHSGPLLFEVNQGSNGTGSGTGGAGGAANPTYSTIAGGNGGAAGGRFVAGTPGSNATDSAAGGGGAGGYGDGSPFIIGSPGGTGGNVTMSPASYLQPVGHTPWTWGTSSNGGTGGSQDPSAPNPQAVGNPAPNSGATGGWGGVDAASQGTGGGGAAGIIIDGVSYGGGGGGEGYDFPIPPTLGGPTGTLSQGAPGFVIVQFLE